MKIISSLELIALKEMFKQGKRIELIYMNDSQAPPVGTQGTVNHVDDAGQIHVNWDNGSTLALIPEVDKFKIIE